jgi:signal transduction histidine kinase
MRTIFANEERLNEILQLVRKATTRGLTITQKIMEYSKLGDHEPGTQMVNIHKLISTIMDECREEFSSQGIVVKYNSRDPLNLVNGDETHFYWVVKNLVLNARDALIDPAAAANEVRSIEVNTTAEDDGFHIVIADNGVGIAEENMQKIFEPFFSTKPATGTGLGLGMVKRIVSLYNGRIDLSSQVGTGTSFTIVLPLRPENGDRSKPSQGV